MSLFNRLIVSRRDHPGQTIRGRAPRMASRARLTLEHLEDRTVPSTIAWLNRGNAVLDTDGMTSVFGTRAATARAVVDAAIGSWQNIITSLHIPPFDGNNFPVTIGMAPAGTGLGAVTVADPSPFGFPTNASISILRGANIDGDILGFGDGGGYFLDPTPTDSAEFNGTVINAFAGAAPAGTTAAGGADLYSTVAHELGHALGLYFNPLLRLQTGGFVTNTGVPDTSPGGGGPGNTGFSGTLWTFVGPSVSTLLTSNNGGPGAPGFPTPLHSAGPGVSVTSGGRSFFGVTDIMNAAGGNGVRTLPSNAVALMLKDAYGYSVVEPETFGTFHALMNAGGPGALLIRGGSGFSADNIRLSRSGGNLVVSVDLGNDVAGVAKGSTEAFVSNFPFASVTSINVLAGDGSDSVTLDFTGGDLIPAGGMNIDGGTGVNVLNVVADANMSLSNFSLTVVGRGIVSLSNMQSSTLTGGLAANTFTISGWTGNASLDGGLGSDSYAVDFNTTGAQDVTITDTGFIGSDRLLVRGTNSSDQLLVSGNQVFHNGESITHSGLEDVTVYGGSGDDSFNLNAATVPTHFFGETGNDLFAINISQVFGFDPVTQTFHLVNTIGAALTVEGGTIFSESGGIDTMNVFFGCYLAGFASAEIAASHLDATGLAAEGLVYHNMDTFSLSMTGGGDAVTIRSTATGVTTRLNTLGGADTVVVGGATVNNIRGHVFIDGGPNSSSGGGDAVILQEIEPAGTVNFGTLGTPANAGPGSGFLSGFGMGDTVNFLNTEAVVITEGPSNDFVSFSFASAPTFVFSLILGGGTDGVTVQGTDKNDHIHLSRRVGPGGPELVADINGQTIVAGYQGGETVSVFAGRGNDTVEIDGNVTTWRAELYGEDGNDELYGGPLADRLDGGDGNDELYGGAGDDELYSGDGRDELHGGDGDDRLEGGHGHDVFDGGAGADRIFAADGQKDTIYADEFDLLFSLDRKDRVIWR